MRIDATNIRETTQEILGLLTDRIGSGGSEPPEEPGPARAARMRFQKKVEALRRVRGWSKAELARRAGIAPKTLHQLEAGRATCYFQTLLKVAAALGVTLMEVFDEADPAENEDAWQQAGATLTQLLLDLRRATA